MKFNANSFLLIAVNCIWLFSLVTTSAFSQQSLSTIKEEIFKLTPELSGTANYSYYLDESKRIYHGPFYFNSSFQRNSFNVDYTFSVELKGSFVKGLKNEDWSFSQSQLNPFGEAQGITGNGYFIKYPASGKMFRINGLFKSGDAQGLWTSGDYRLTNGRISDTTRLIQANLNKNMFQGAFSGFNDQFGVKGTVSEEGFIDGKWVINHNYGTVVEERLYKEGVLIEHYISKDGIMFPIQHLGLDAFDDSFAEVEISNVYLDILYQTNVIGSSAGSKKLSADYSKNLIAKSNAFIFESLNSFSYSDSLEVWKLTEGSSTFNLPKIKVKINPYSSKEREMLVQIVDLLHESNALVDTFLLDSQVKISMHSVEKIAYHHSVLSIYEVQLKRLSNLIELLNQPSFEFVDRSTILPFLASDIQFPAEVSYFFGDEKKNKPAAFPAPLLAKELSISSVYNLIKEINAALNMEQNMVEPILSDMKKIAGIADKEETLLKKRDSIINSFENKLGADTFNQYHERYTEQVVSFIQKRFSSYAKLPIEKRLTLIESELDCFDQYLSFYAFLAKLPKRLNEIDDLYTRTVWNPFTLTDMQEKVKERIFTAYQKTLLPFLLDDLEQGMSCAISNRMDNFSTLFSKMKLLREQDTQELEAKLKRTSSIEQIVQAFEINFNSNN